MTINTTDFIHNGIGGGDLNEQKNKEMCKLSFSRLEDNLTIHYLNTEPKEMTHLLVTASLYIRLNLSYQTDQTDSESVRHTPTASDRIKEGEANYLTHVTGRFSAYSSCITGMKQDRLKRMKKALRQLIDPTSSNYKLV
jgi:hypothetical protein